VNLGRNKIRSANSARELPYHLQLVHRSGYANTAQYIVLKRQDALLFYLIVFGVARNAPAQCCSLSSDCYRLPFVFSRAQRQAR
jgi:hypothetical protein